MPFAHHVLHLVDAVDEALDQVLFAAHFGRRVHGLLDVHQHGLIGAVAVVVLLHQHQDVVDVDLDLPYQLRFEHDVVHDVGALVVFLGPLVLQVLVDAHVVLHVAVAQYPHADELIEGGQQVPHPQDGPEQLDKPALPFLPGDLLLRHRELIGQLGDHVHIAVMVLSIDIDEAFIIVPERLQDDDTGGVLVPEQGNGAVHPLLQVAEAYDVPEGLDGIQDAVGAAEGLDEPVGLQVFVHPQGIEGGGVKAGQEHVHHDQQVQLLVLHPEGYVLVIVLEFVAGGVIVRVEHLVIVGDGALQEVPAGLIQGARILRVFLIDDAVSLGLVRAVAEDGGDPQPAGGVRRHLLFEFPVIQLRHRHGGDRKNGVEALDVLGGLLLLHPSLLGPGHLRDVGQPVVGIAGPVGAVGLLLKMLQDVFGHQGNALRGHERLFLGDAPHLLIVDILVHVHRFDVVHPEGQHVFIVDGVHDGVGMELVPEGLLGGECGHIAHRAGIRRKDRGAGEAEDVVFFEAPHNGIAHVAELAAVAFIEDHHHMLSVDLMHLVVVHKVGQLLDGGDDDPGIRVLQLTLQDSGAGVAVGAALFEPVVFLHGLVVQVLPVHHEQHLIDAVKLARHARRFEGGQRFPAAGGMPNVPAACDGAVFLVVGGYLDAIQYPLRGGDLVGPHHQQHVFRCEYAVLRQDIQQGMLCKERPGEVHQIGDHPVVGIGPEAGEFKAVAGLLLLRCAGLRVLDGVEPGAVGIVFGVGAVGDHEDLHIFKQAAACPEGVPLVPVDLVERFPDRHAAAFQLNMHERQTVHEHRHIIPVIVPRSLIL